MIPHFRYVCYITDIKTERTKQTNPFVVNALVSAMELKCCFWTVDSPCGAEGVGSRICPLLSCTRDIESHLVSLGLGSKRGAAGSKITEVELILNRAGRFAVREDE